MLKARNLCGQPCPNLDGSGLPHPQPLIVGKVLSLGLDGVKLAVERDHAGRALVAKLERFDPFSSRMVVAAARFSSTLHRWPARFSDIFSIAPSCAFKMRLTMLERGLYRLFPG